MAKPPTDQFMGMLDCAWDDFKTYQEKGAPSTPLGILVVLVGHDGEELTIKSGANMHPGWVQAALVQLVMGMATESLAMEQVPSIKKKRVV